MKTSVRSPRDFWAGVMFVGFGALFAGISFGYPLGTPARMGAGLFPFCLGLLLASLGIVIVLASLRMEGRKLGTIRWAPVLWVLAPIAFFGFMLKLTGVLVAGTALVVGSSLGSGEFKLKETLVLATVLVAFCAAVFVGALKLAIPLCPGLNFFAQFPLCNL
jgi:hypothetical protein